MLGLGIGLNDIPVYLSRHGTGEDSTSYLQWGGTNITWGTEPLSWQ